MFKKIFRKTIFKFLTAINFNSFQRKWINTLKDAPWEHIYDGHA